jgi:hypothetical protein
MQRKSEIIFNFQMAKQTQRFGESGAQCKTKAPDSKVCWKEPTDSMLSPSKFQCHFFREIEK